MYNYDARISHHQDLLEGIQCMECGGAMAPHIFALACPQCGSRQLEARYEYDRIPKNWPALIATRPENMWRYQELLPLPQQQWPVSMNEGWTPLIHAQDIEAQVEHNLEIWLKSETPMSIQKRTISGTISALKGRGHTNIVLNSCVHEIETLGAYCQHAKLGFWALVDDKTSEGDTRRMNASGAKVVRIAGNPKSHQLTRQGFSFERVANGLPAREIMKTIAFEISEQLDWHAPDWYLQTTSSMIDAVMVMKGFSELHQLGFIAKVPQLGLIEITGTMPLGPGGRVARTSYIKNSHRITVAAQDLNGFSQHPQKFLLTGLKKLVQAGTIQDGELLVLNPIESA